MYTRIILNRQGLIDLFSDFIDHLFGISLQEKRAYRNDKRAYCNISMNIVLFKNKNYILLSAYCGGVVAEK